MVNDIKQHGIYEQEQGDIHAENLNRLGFTVFRKLIPLDVVAKIKDAMYAAYDRQCTEVGGEENLKKINDECIIRTLFAYDKTFISDVLMQPDIIKFLDIHLDASYIIHSQVGVISRSNRELYQYAWHREVQYQHFTSSRPMAIQSLFALDPFNASTGGTFFLPGSHLFEKFPSNEFIRNNEVQPELNPGDVVMMNSMTYHRSGFNTSGNDRLLITNTFSRPIFATQFNHAKAISPEGLSEREREILGFRWDHSLSMQEWRKRRIENSR